MRHRVQGLNWNHYHHQWLVHGMMPDDGVKLKKRPPSSENSRSLAKDQDNRNAALNIFKQIGQALRPPKNNEGDSDSQSGRRGSDLESENSRVYEEDEMGGGNQEKSGFSAANQSERTLTTQKMMMMGAQSCCAGFGCYWISVGYHIVRGIQKNSDRAGLQILDGAYFFAAGWIAFFSAILSCGCTMIENTPPPYLLFWCYFVIILRTITAIMIGTWADFAFDPKDEDQHSRQTVKDSEHQRLNEYYPSRDFLLWNIGALIIFSLTTYLWYLIYSRVARKREEMRKNPFAATHL